MVIFNEAENNLELLPFAVFCYYFIAKFRKKRKKAEKNYFPRIQINFINNRSSMRGHIETEKNLSLLCQSRVKGTFYLIPRKSEIAYNHFLYQQMFFSHSNI